MQTPRLAGRGAGGNIVELAGCRSDTTAFAPPQAPVAVEIDAGTLTDMRAMWWRLARRHGTPLPAERGIIPIDGGRE